MGFLGKLGITAVVALILGAIAYISVLAARRNAKEREPDRRREAACSSCALSQLCLKYGQDAENCVDRQTQTTE